MINWLLDFVYPRHCFGCKTSGTYLCSECLKNCETVSEYICPVCRKKAIDGRVHPICQTAFCLDGLLSLYQYQGTMEELVKAFKYRFAYDLERSLTPLIRQQLSVRLRQNASWQTFCQTNPLVVPVPLYPYRQRWRGFNQAQVIGRMVAKFGRWKLALNLLVRQRQTKPQAELTKAQRMKNLRNVFSLNPSFGKTILPSSVLLVDDVWTTGATLSECGRVLKRAGVKTVWAMTVCR
jgi:ComF family protein